MKTRLTAEQIQQYQRDGALIYRGFMDDAEVKALIKAIEEGIGQMGTNVVAGNKEFGEAPRPESDDYYSKVFLQRVNLWKLSPEIKRIFLGPELGEMVSRL